MLYNKFSQFLKDKYGSKVYKLPLNLPVTCPNRDGSLGWAGCIFCGEEGAGFENLSCEISVADQLEQNVRYIGKNYGSEKFIAYFQNYSNTYLPYELFVKNISEACREGIVAIYISTRPDCIADRYMEFLAGLKEEKGIDIVMELGLQTVNYHTLKLLNRGHTLAEFIDAAIRIRKYRLGICAHYITDLPMDNVDDVIEGAKIISALGVSQVKCHSLFILKNTELERMYSRGEIQPITIDEFIDRTIRFLEHLDPDIVVQRLIGRAPAERTVFCNWNTSWWKLQDMIEAKMVEQNTCQGRLYKAGNSLMNKIH
ncbi:TIGR01212 family radical SAM protein [Ruminiclostridium cellobioparum]|uniref:Radical SAM protein, TIGR01212 family n=1 Tax=Ruminiclostridium cellobioparum subsp. termitidis CT1112 TaxID=1195236 RepID=S0FM34_RUMCE|nr:TIGR01212 family radical SAM protein [Ruminiclostridium cellobioparum]EMS69543.1 radical SAM protein, TIGR01212 family [Ruminiclostridium cellobioparum subsp. termitidis CT1112]